MAKHRTFSFTLPVPLLKGAQPHHCHSVKTSKVFNRPFWGNRTGLKLAENTSNSDWFWDFRSGSILNLATLTTPLYLRFGTCATRPKMLQ